LDGTLLDSEGNVSERTRTVIRKVLEKYPDLHFVLASGRARPATMEIREALGILDRPNTESLLCNGCIIYDYQGNIVWQSTLPKEFVIKAYNLFKTDPTSVYFYSTGDDAIMFSEKWAKISSERYKEHTVLSDKEEYIKKVQSDKVKINKMCAIVSEGKDIEKIKPILLEYCKEYNLEYAYSTSFFLEFMPQNTHKGTALEQLIKNLNIKKEEVLAFGDGGNDINLLKSSGWPVAVDNACDELKSIAKITTKSNAEDGVADLLERIFLS
ncbi:hypothetical protein BCR36DRAFT_297996, partial [Piromyces finnis]